MLLKEMLFTYNVANTPICQLAELPAQRRRDAVLSSIGKEFVGKMWLYSEGLQRLLQSGAKVEVSRPFPALANDKLGAPPTMQ